jgi:hypothetical protein
MLQTFGLVAGVVSAAGLMTVDVGSGLDGAALGALAAGIGAGAALVVLAMTDVILPATRA